MTEADWLSSANPRQMFEHLARDRHARTKDRKWLLLACALCRGLWDQMDEQWQQVVEFVEQCADSASSGEGWPEWRNVIGSRCEALPKLPFAPAAWTPNLMAPHAVGILVGDVPEVAVEFLLVRLTSVMINEGRRAEEEQRQCDLFRDIFGSPFRQVVSTGKQTTELLDLARSIYEKQTFDRMGKLSEALEGAGWDEAILCHCSSERLHARGCWVLDLILGKA